MSISRPKVEAEPTLEQLLERNIAALDRVDKSLDRVDQALDRNTRAFERVDKSLDRNTEAFDRNTRAFERNSVAFQQNQQVVVKAIALLDRIHARLDQQDNHTMRLREQKSEPPSE